MTLNGVVVVIYTTCKNTQELSISLHNVHYLHVTHCCHNKQQFRFFFKNVSHFVLFFFCNRGGL